MNPESDPVIAIIIVVVISFFVILFLAGLAIKINEFSHELDYINREIGRTTGGEQRHWKREKTPPLAISPAILPKVTSNISLFLYALKVF